MSQLEDSRQQQEQALAREIVADAQKRAERIKQRAAREAQKTIGDAERRASMEHDRIIQDARQHAAHRQEVERARTEQQLESLRRRARHQIVERVRREAEEELAQVADGHQSALGGLKKLAVLAIRAMSGDRFQLVLRAQDRDRWADELAVGIRQAVRAELGRDVRVEIAADALQAVGGLVVRSADRRQVADQTFEGRMRRLWDQISGELMSDALLASTDE